MISIFALLPSPTFIFLYVFDHWNKYSYFYLGFSNSFLHVYVALVSYFSSSPPYEPFYLCLCHYKNFFINHHASLLVLDPPFDAPKTSSCHVSYFFRTFVAFALHQPLDPRQPESSWDVSFQFSTIYLRVVIKDKVTGKLLWPQKSL